MTARARVEATPNTPNLPRILDWSVLVVLLAMPVWPFLSTWLGSWSGELLLLKSLLVVALMFIAAVGLGYLATARRDVLKNIVSKPMVWLMGLFAAIVVAAILVVDNHQKVELAAAAMDLRYFLAFVIALALAKLDPDFWRGVLAKLPSAMIAIGVGLALLGLVQVTLLPKDFLAHFGYGPDTIMPYITIDDTTTLRAFATLRGPNDFGAFLMLPLLLAGARIVKNLLARAKKHSKHPKLDHLGWQITVFLVILAGLLASSSRSAILASAVALSVTVLWLLPKAIFRTRRFWLTVAGIIAAALLFLAFALSQPVLRLRVLHMSVDRDHTASTSNEDHKLHLVDSLGRVIEQPLGCGAGCSGPASFYGYAAQISENYYLQIAEQYGVLGLAVWLAAMILVTIALWKRRRAEIYKVWLAALVGYSLIGMLLHVFADEPLTIVWFAVAGALVALPELKKPSRTRSAQK
jgi:hypothetical protein